MKNRPPSSNIVAPDSPNAWASFDVRNWLLPSRCVCCKPVLMDPSEILHPEVSIQALGDLTSRTLPNEKKPGNSINYIQ